MHRDAGWRVVDADVELAVRNRLVQGFEDVEVDTDECAVVVRGDADLLCPAGDLVGVRRRSRISTTTSRSSALRRSLTASSWKQTNSDPGTSRLARATGDVNM
jgi:hypothetical protein